MMDIVFFRNIFPATLINCCFFIYYFNKIKHNFFKLHFLRPMMPAVSHQRTFIMEDGGLYTWFDDAEYFLIKPFMAQNKIKDDVQYYPTNSNEL